MCRGPFKCKQLKQWIQERNERDLIFESGVDLILSSKDVYSWCHFVDDDGVAKYWGRRVTKIDKLKEFQLAYNALSDVEWEYEEDFEEFVLNDDVQEIIDNERVYTIYYNDPVKEWITKYPYII